MSFCTDPESVCLKNYVIHTITGLVKRWLRELPDPLMTFDLYTDFLHAVGELNCYFLGEGEKKIYIYVYIYVLH